MFKIKTRVLYTQRPTDAGGMAMSSMAGCGSGKKGLNSMAGCGR